MDYSPNSSLSRVVRSSSSITLSSSSSSISSSAYSESAVRLLLQSSNAFDAVSTALCHCTNALKIAQLYGLTAVYIATRYRLNGDHASSLRIFVTIQQTITSRTTIQNNKKISIWLLKNFHQTVTIVTFYN